MVFSLSCASSTVLPKSRSLTLNKTLPQHGIFAVYHRGPSLFISATASKGIGPIPWFVPAVFLSLQYYFYTLVHIWHLQKTLSPSYGSQCHSTNCRFNIIHIVNAEAYLPIASRFAISIYFHQLLARHTNLSSFGSFQRLLIFLCQSFDGI
jgi:hypothetical protein